MKARILTIMLLTAVLFAGAFLSLANFSSTNQQSLITEANNEQLNALVLGDVENTLNTSIQCLGIEYIDGYIWAVNNPGGLYKLNPNTGSTILSYSQPFQATDIATDGTYIYIGVEESGNGTIFKYTLSGNLVSNISVPVTSYFVGGLTCHGGYLYVTLDDPVNYLFRINLNTWTLDGTPIPLSRRYVGMTWFKDMIWVTDWSAYEIHALDPTTGQIREVFNHPAGAFGCYGIVYNGTHMLCTEWDAQKIYVTDVPTQAGEVWNQHPAPYDHPLDIAWNGTHYFLTDSSSKRIYILDAGTFKNTSSFAVPFTPLGITVIGDYLYISQSSLPYNIYKYTQKGNLVTTFAAGHRYYALEYDGSKLWASYASNSFITQLNPADCTIIKNFSVSTDYAGLTYDSKNNVFWAVNWISHKIVELNPSDFSETGYNFSTPANVGEFGLEFNGEYLIFDSWNTETIYKIIIDFPAGGIPGFSDAFLLLSAITIVGIFFLLRHRRYYLSNI